MIYARMLLIDLILRGVRGPPPNSLIRLLVLLPCERSLSLIFLETIRRTRGCDLELPLPIRRTGAHRFYLLESKLMNLGQMMVRNS
jgi:hypothetical protein